MAKMEQRVSEFMETSELYLRGHSERESATNGCGDAGQTDEEAQRLCNAVLFKVRGN